MSRETYGPARQRQYVMTGHWGVDAGWIWHGICRNMAGARQRTRTEVESGLRDDRGCETCISAVSAIES